MSVSWYSTRQVGNTVTLPWRLVRLIFGRFLNQVEKRCLAYGGSRRTGDTPVTLATALRMPGAGLGVDDLVGDRAVVVASVPSRSVRPIIWVVALSGRT